MKYLIFAVFLLASVCVSGQQSDAQLPDAIPRHAIRASPLHLLNFYPTVQLGYEANLKGRFSIYTEGGVAVNFTDQNHRFRNMRGFKLKLEPRYYLSVNRKGNALWYSAGEIYYNRIRFDRRTTRIECFDRDCQFQYERQFEYKGAYREHGFGIKGGLMIGKRRIFVDINSGFAIRLIDYDVPGSEAGGIEDNMGWGWNDIPNERDRTAITPLLGIRLGYRLL